MQEYAQKIENYFDNPTSTNSSIELMIDEVLRFLSNGTLRVVDKIGENWVVNPWVKKAIILAFRMRKNLFYPGLIPFFDKINLRHHNWNESDFQSGGFRNLPGAIVREGAYIGKKVILMPSFVNIGAFVDEGTMVDTWSTIGSCARIGKNCHISGGVGIGGVLEPAQAQPVIIEDNCFIGARSEIAEGVIVKEGSVISMGVFIGASTKIVNRQTGEIHKGFVPPYSVVVPGVLPIQQNFNPMTPMLSCAVIVKQVDAQTRAKTSINEILRD